MATYVLDGRSSAQLDRGPLAVRLANSGAAAQARLAARSDSGNPVRVIQTSPDFMILPSIDESVSVGAVPDRGLERFPQGTVLHVSIQPENAATTGGDIATLAPRDVSGLAFVDLASVAPDANGKLAITTRLAVEDSSLPPVAAAARIASRGVLGADHVSASKELKVRCVVDASTSMATAFARNAVGACGDIVTGMAAVLGDESSIEFVVPAPSFTTFQTATAGSLGDTLATVPPTGLGIAPDLRAALAAPVSGRTLTVVVTDGIGSLPVLATTPDRPIVTLSVSDAAADTMVGDAAANCPVSVATDIRAHLGAHAEAVTTIVTGLLAPLKQQGVLG